MNHELEKLYAEPDIVATIRKRLINGLGHIHRMPDERMPKKLLNSEPEGTRMRGRPRKTWREVVDKVLAQLGVLRGWGKLAEDRRKWRDVAQEALSLKGDVAPRK